MLRYALLACLYLLVEACGQLTDDDRSAYQEPWGRQPNTYFISPDIFDDRETFVVAQYEEPLHQSPRKILMAFTLFNDKRDTKPKQCLLILHPKPHTYKWNVTSLRRVSETKFVLSWYQQGNNELFPTSQVFAYDMKNCQETYLGLDNVIRNPIVVPTTNETVLVFVNDRNSCRMLYTKCFWSYDLSRNAHSEIRRFSTEINWSTLNIERLSSGKFVASGSSMEGDRYMAMLMALFHPVGFMTEPLMNIPYNNLKVEIVSSGMSLCWIENPKDKMTVHCRQMNDSGGEIFNKTINFDVPRTLIDVHATREGELLLITKNATCNDKHDCWDMWATRVRPNMKQVERLSLAFSACTVDDQHELTIFGAQNDAENIKTDLYYGCRKEKGFYFSYYKLYFYDL